MRFAKAACGQFGLIVLTGDFALNNDVEVRSAKESRRLARESIEEALMIAEKILQNKGRASKEEIIALLSAEIIATERKSACLENVNIFVLSAMAVYAVVTVFSGVYDWSFIVIMFVFAIAEIALAVHCRKTHSIKSRLIDAQCAAFEYEHARRGKEETNVVDFPVVLKNCQS